MRNSFQATLFWGAAAFLGAFVPFGDARAQNAPPAGASSPQQTAPAPRPAASSAEQRENEARAALKAAYAAATKGPAEVKLIDQGALALPVGMVFIPQAQAARMLRAFGNKVDGAGPIGVVTSPRDEDDWMVVVRFVKEGYIKDDDARDWNAAELLDNLKQGNDAGNADRRARGFPEREIVGWIEPPAYDAATHRLVWSLASRQKGAGATGDDGVNYNTYALGREGYFSLNLLTSEKRVGADKAVSRTLLTALSYDDGKRYDQFNSATDNVAAYGLAALVGGAVAKKAGLFAVAAAFAAKFAKIIALAVAGLFGGLFSLFKRGGKTDA